MYYIIFCIFSTYNSYTSIPYLNRSIQNISPSPISVFVHTKLNIYVFIQLAKRFENEDILTLISMVIFDQSSVIV